MQLDIQIDIYCLLEKIDISLVGMERLSQTLY